MIATLPNGFAAVVSGAAEGSMSDREITKRCGFLDYLEEGDKVLADRGFTIEDLVLEKKAKLAIPPFLRGRKKFTYKELMQSRLITKARIHVERFNQRLKLYKFISDVPVEHHKLELFDDALYVCSMLVNFSQVFAK